MLKEQLQILDLRVLEELPLCLKNPTTTTKRIIYTEWAGVVVDSFLFYSFLCFAYFLAGKLC